MKKRFLLPLISLLFLLGCKDADVQMVSTGTGGSMARFTITADRLYIAELDTLWIVDISTATDPVFVRNTVMQANSETIFPYQQMLFIGSPTGMEVLSIANPDDPQFLGFADHILGCDPVVVQDSIAYVTVRTGSPCRSQEVNSRLIVNDVHDPTYISMVYQDFLDDVYGLGTHDTLLYVCKGDFGLEVYSINQPTHPIPLYTLDSLHAWDVIPDGNRLILIGETGLIQYSFQDPRNPVFLSQIPQ